MKEDPRWFSKRWLTKTGAVLLFIGGVLTAATKKCPVEVIIPYLYWIGDILVYAGGGMMGVGLGRKLDRLFQVMSSLDDSKEGR
jgi:hypothetical protein